MPKKLIFRVPPLAACTYRLKIVTRFLSSNTVIQEARMVIYDLSLTVS
ncbi:MAG: DUF4469 domain-containing protein [Spirochaetaceae bacterium]|nr:DUF4469 domain-containing protein [Spirochaetaceae bacterium]